VSSRLRSVLDLAAGVEAHGGEGATGTAAGIYSHGQRVVGGAGLVRIVAAHDTAEALVGLANGIKVAAAPPQRVALRREWAGGV